MDEDFKFNADFEENLTNFLLDQNMDDDKTITLLAYAIGTAMNRSCCSKHLQELIVALFNYLGKTFSKESGERVH